MTRAPFAPPARLSRTLRGLRRGVLARRRSLASVLVGVAVLAGLREAAPPPVAEVPVTVAGHDLAAGTVLSGDDLRTTRLPAGALPTGLARHPEGRTLAAPLREGEPVTDVRLVGDGLASGYAGRVVVPLRFPDAAAAGLLHPGDRVDVLAADPRTGEAEPLAPGALVVVLPAESGSAGQPPAGRLVLLAVSPTDANSLSVAQADRFLTYVMTD